MEQEASTAGPLPHIPIPAAEKARAQQKPEKVSLSPELKRGQIRYSASTPSIPQYALLKHFDSRTRRAGGVFQDLFMGFL